MQFVYHIEATFWGLSLVSEVTLLVELYQETCDGVQEGNVDADLYRMGHHSQETTEGRIGAVLFDKLSIVHMPIDKFQL